MENKRWTVETIKHRKTGLKIAVSDDLPGLYVHGRTDEELFERIPLAIKALLEAEGLEVGEIVRCEDEELPPAFDAQKVQYSATPCYA